MTTLRLLVVVARHGRSLPVRHCDRLVHVLDQRTGIRDRNTLRRLPSLLSTEAGDGEDSHRACERVSDLKRRDETYRKRQQSARRKSQGAHAQHDAAPLAYGIHTR